LLYLTLLRPGEVAGLQWAEIDFPNALLRLPPEHMKARRAHLVPLSSQALHALERVRPYSGTVHVFPNRRGGDAAGPSGNVLPHALQAMGFDGAAVPHGFRKTASTLLHEMNWNSDWIEMQLAHKEGGVRARYNHAQYLSHRREMLQAWADFCDQLGAGAEVIPIRLYA
jgi:integrase